MRRSPSHRPERYKLNPHSPLAGGLVFAGLGGNGCVGSLTLRDESIYGNHGTLTNFAFPATATSGWDWNSYLRRPILRFDGSNDVVKGSNGSDFHGSTGFTLAAWINWTTVGGTADALFSKTAADGSVSWWFFSYDNAADNLAFQAGGVLRVSANNVVPPGLHHVAMTYDGSDTGTGVRFYVDGRETGYTTTASNPFSGENVGAYFTIGNRLAVDRPFDGWMADVLFLKGVWSMVVAPLSDPANIDLRVGGVPLLLSSRKWWPVSSASGVRRRRLICSGGR